MQTLYSYKDIVLEPKYSEIKSRKELDCSVKLLDRVFKSAAIPANMKCTISFRLAEQLSQEGYFYVLHRFYDYKDILEWIRNNQHLKTISISIGVGEKDKDLVRDIVCEDLRVDFVTIDVAHGHHLLVKQMLSYIRQEDIMPRVRVIAGNVGTVKGANDLHSWGADIVKVGLSMGKSCTTYNCTGVGTPMFSTVKNITENTSVPVIADGQVREVGDICKALVAGASMVMVGSEFAKCKDSPAEIGVTANGRDYKTFYGSASKVNKGHSDFAEGQVVFLEMSNDTYDRYFQRINQGIQSCMSYCGVTEISQLNTMDFSIRTQ